MEPQQKSYTGTSSIPLRITYVLLILLGVFQLALIFGVPWGHAAWGGQYRVLPKLYRFGSVSSIGLYCLFAWILRRRERHPEYKFPKVASWVLVGYSVMGIIANSASSSRYENFIWAPVSLVLTMCMVLIARGRAHHQ